VVRVTSAEFLSAEILLLLEIMFVHKPVKGSQIISVNYVLFNGGLVLFY